MAIHTATAEHLSAKGRIEQPKMCLQAYLGRYRLFDGRERQEMQASLGNTEDFRVSAQACKFR